MCTPYMGQVGQNSNHTHCVTLPERGPSTFRFRGRMLTRVHGFADVDELTCPDHHRVLLGGFTIREDGALTCTNKASAGAGECGALLWLLFVQGANRRKRFYAADVVYAELDLWEKNGASVQEILQYLGAWFARADDR
ncbi:MAG: hypothetical protein JWM95_1411 [Gemmatimonadetes bacterium]|nr:hypothetical protein [Gemmatimonadota bacterium]